MVEDHCTEHYVAEFVSLLPANEDCLYRYHTAHLLGAHWPLQERMTSQGPAAQDHRTILASERGTNPP